MRTWVAVTMSSLALGCVIYDEELIPDEAGALHPQGDGSDDTAAEANYTLWLEPAGGVPGDTTIVSRKAEGDVDLSKVADIRFLGGSTIDVLATNAHDPKEYLLTIDISEDASLGANDILVQFADGTAAYIEAAFEVVSDPSQVPESEGSPDDSEDGSDEDGC